MTDPQKPIQNSRAEIPFSRDLNRIYSLLKTNLQGIEKEHHDFFGALKIEVNFQEREIETVIVDRRQSFKN